MKDELEHARATMARVFGYAEFLPGQEATIGAVLNGEDVFAVLPTAGGKSLSYQLPALLGRGPALVVSPLIALMRDQVASLRARGVAAGALHSGNDEAEAAAVERDARERRLKVLYVAPERLALDSACAFIAHAGFRLLAIDEAHCVSQWGHDFRPDYLGLGEFSQRLGDVRILALTATANRRARAEIVELLFPGRRPRVIVGGFDRPNLRLALVRRSDAFRQIAAFVSERRGKAGIVYCRARATAESLASALAARGHRALAYHAGLDADTRATRQDEFVARDDVVMCATVAFGLGVHKPDIRFVCHADTPSSIEAWYQETGRAGRDGKPADTMALWSPADFAAKRARVAFGVRSAAGMQEVDAIEAFCRSGRCRRVLALEAFDDAVSPRRSCGECDNCRAGVRRVGALVSGDMGLWLRRRAREWPNALARRLSARRASDAPEPDSDRESEPRPNDLSDLSGRWPIADQPRLSTHALRLLAALRARRLEIARARRVAPKLVIGDTALAALAARPPASVDELATLDGWAEAARDGRGEAFLRVARQFADNSE